MFTLCANLIEKCIWSSAISCRFSAMLLFHFVRQAIHSSSLAWISGPATINKIQVAFFASRTKVMPAADALQGHKEGVGKAGQGLGFESLLLYIECQSICKCRLINDAIIVATRQATPKAKKKKAKRTESWTHPAASSDVV